MNLTRLRQKKDRFNTCPFLHHIKAVTILFCRCCFSRLFSLLVVGDFLCGFLLGSSLLLCGFLISGGFLRGSGFLSVSLLIGGYFLLISFLLSGDCGCRRTSCGRLISGISVLAGMYRKRLKTYKMLGYFINGEQSLGI